MATSPEVIRRRRIVAVVALARRSPRCSSFAVTQLTGSDAAEPPRRAAQGGARGRRRRRSRSPSSRAAGARSCPDYRVVAYYGAPQDKQLGALGIGSPAAARARSSTKQAKGYERKSRPVMPAMELIAVVAAAHPGEGGRYNLRQPDSVIRRYLKAARKAKALLILDIQPGRSDFFTETKRLRKWLKEPDVGLALDPEWRMGPGQVPGQVIGSVSAREVNATTRLAGQADASATSCRRSSC